ncbi:MAG: hypothetical protein WD595_04375 [Waddliaceae bacterium]
MENKHKTSRLSIEMPVNEHKKLKTMAALNGMSVKNLVLSCLYDHLLSSNVPNVETIKEFEETDKGEGIITCSDIDDLFTKLKIDK